MYSSKHFFAVLPVALVHLHSSCSAHRLNMEGVLNLETLKVPQLKALLKEKGLPVSGRKDELIKRLRSLPVGPKPKA